jgi:5-dehydro-4-deoxyglucarate dehydratase
MDPGELVTPAPLTARLSVPSGPLFFPVTAYGPDGAVDLDTYRRLRLLRHR